jgi:hypothetical protein
MPLIHPVVLLLIALNVVQAINGIVRMDKLDGGHVQLLSSLFAYENCHSREPQYLHLDNARL